MADYSQLTDAELDARINALKAGGSGAPPPSAPAAPSPTGGAPAVSPYAGLSDTELDERLASARQLAAGVIPTKQEMHPDFTDADRLVVKNFATNNEAATNYLQKRHPNLEISVDKTSQQLRARRRDGSEKEYRVLDPENGFFGTLARPGELLRDVGDVGYDVASGIGSGVATAAAGVAGAAASGGALAIPAAMAGGAASSAGLEGLKQAIGSQLGLENNYDGTDIAIAGGAGAISPLLFGTGAGAKQVAKAGVTQASQRGLPGMAWDGVKSSVLPRMGASASGASKEAVKTLGTHYDDLARLEKDPLAITNFTREAGQNVRKKLGAAKNQAYGVYQAGLQEAQDAGAMVDVSDVSLPLKEAIERAQELADESPGNEASHELVSQLREQFKKHFIKTEEVTVPEQVRDALTGAMMDTGKVTTKTVQRELDVLSPRAAADLERRLGEMGELSLLKPDGLGAGNRHGNASNDEKAIRELGAAMKNILGEHLDAVLPEGAMAARRRTGEIINLQKRAATLIKSPQKAFSSLRNADKTPNATTAELFSQLDREFSTDLVDRAHMMDAYATFGKPSSVPLSGAGSTSTSRSIPAAATGTAIGGTLGYYGGPNEDRGFYGAVGAFGGGALGSMGGSPAMIRRYIKAGLGAQRLNQGLGPLRPGLGGQALQSPWLGVDERKRGSN